MFIATDPASVLLLRPPTTRSAAERWSAGTLPAAIATSGVGLVVAVFLPVDKGPFLRVGGIGVIAALALCVFEPRESRRVFLSVFFWAFAARLILLDALLSLSAHVGGPFLGPDGTSYWFGAQELAASAFHLPAHPTTVFGSLDVAHYYLFAAAIRFLGADLYGLQLINCFATALVAPLVFAIARRVIPEWAGLISLAIAFYPSMIVLSAADLLKDPTIILATVAFARAVVNLDGPLARTVAMIALATVALLYLRTARGYIVFHIEFAATATFVYCVVPNRWASVGARRTLLVLAIFAAGEALPMAAGWPSSPSIFVGQVRHTLGTPRMREADLGLLRPWRARGGSPLSPEENASARGGSPLSPANLFRKMFGPFVWILPDHWNVERILRADYLLYPGMLVWYALLPLCFAGLILAAIGWAVAPRLPIALLPFWIVLITYGGQYLAINLSYRQREAMFPFLVMFAAIGIARLRDAQWARAAYAAYWAVLVAVAVVHLAVRTHMGLS